MAGPDKFSPRDFLDRYERERRHATNRRLHVLALPVLYAGIVLLLWTLPIPARWHEPFLPTFNWAVLFVLGSIVYGALIALLPAILVAVFALLCLLLADLLSQAGAQLWLMGGLLVAAAWLLMAAGHRREGNQTAWLGRSQYLPVGLVWVMSLLLARLRPPR